MVLMIRNFIFSELIVQTLEQHLKSFGKIQLVSQSQKSIQYRRRLFKLTFGGNLEEMSLVQWFNM